MDGNSPRRRLPRRPLLAVLVLIAALTGAPVALGADLPSITLGGTAVSGNIGSIASVPTFMITGLAGATINWNFTGTPTNSGTAADATPVDGGDGPYTLHATQTPLDPQSLEATVSFTLDRFAAPPTFSSPLPPAANATSATFAWAGEGPTFTCRLTGPTGFASQSSPGGTVTVPLTTGTCQFFVSTTDSSGNTSAEASQGLFTVDTGFPTGGALAHAPVRTRSSASRRRRKSRSTGPWRGVSPYVERFLARGRACAPVRPNAGLVGVHHAVSTGITRWPAGVSAIFFYKVLGYPSARVTCD